MTLTAWRLVKWKHYSIAFSGEGSRLYGGRWNSPGSPVNYVSDSQALCALENIVHFDKGKTPPAYAFVSAQFDDFLVQVLAVKLPPNWATMQAATVAIGDAWLIDPKSSCILAVPTSLAPEGTNYLINPMHPDFSKVTIGSPIAFAFDQRFNPLGPQA